jgi:hypothetical protein
MGALKTKKRPAKPRVATPPKRRPRTTDPTRAAFWDKVIVKEARA